MKIVDLNLDCLLAIFKYCSEEDLLNVCRTHVVLRNVIEENVFRLKTLDLLMCGHRGQPCIEQRTQKALSYSDRILVARNWEEGRYRDYSFFYHPQMFPTKIHLERDWFYMTHAGYIRQHRRQRPLNRRYQREISTGAKTDIADFVKKQETIFAGRVCGSCFIYECDYVTEQRLHTSKEYLHCVDFANDLYVTGTDRCAKLWRRSEEFGLIHLDMLREFSNAYKVLQLNETGDRLFGGLYTDVNRRALREINLETGVESMLNSNTISIYDLKLKDDNIIFTANFDTTFRMHDRRINSDVAIWEDPFDSSFYCLDYDGLYAVLCGAKYHSRVNLYDIRVPGNYMQLYFPSRSLAARSSPVYDVACDSRYLFVATDHSIRVLDYKVSNAEKKDYRNIFLQWRHV